jgi:hypothetical protein
MRKRSTAREQRLLEDIREGLERSVAYYKSGTKGERERWVCAEFLTNLALPFSDGEVTSSSDEPPDVNFREARFEIKEILDPGRRRHAEYKTAYAEALNATHPKSLLKQYTPREITPTEIVERVLPELTALASYYAPSVRKGLDALCYVNLLEHTLVDGPMPPPRQLAPYGWRSISVLFSWTSIVYTAESSAPAFLRARNSSLTTRSFE